MKDAIEIQVGEQELLLMMNTLHYAMGKLQDIASLSVARDQQIEQMEALRKRLFQVHMLRQQEKQRQAKLAKQPTLRFEATE